MTVDDTVGRSVGAPVGGGERDTVAPEELRSLFLFEKMTDEQLAWLSARTHRRVVSEGEFVFRLGEQATCFVVLLDGEVQLLTRTGNEDIVTVTSAQRGSYGGAVRGFADTDDDQLYVNSMRAVRRSTVMEISRTDFAEMMRTWYPIAVHLLDGLFLGMRNTQQLTQQREKLVALGQMSAGLAHELNNPAGAAARATSTLRERIAGMRHKLGMLASGKVEPSQLLELVKVQENAVERVAKAKRLTALETGDREDELSDWIDDRHIAGGWDLAPTLVAGGLDVEWADELADTITPGLLEGALRWIAYTVETENLMTEIEEAVTRMSTLVGAVKQYTYMDQAPEQDIDVHDGLESTLVMLGHKVKRLNVVRDYDRTLPRVPAHGSELNQVWTNLIDNAADSMGEDGGTLTLRTARDGDWLLVEIGDTGPGVPEEIRSRIFDAFFTTKDVGAGTGMGLDISNRIVRVRHSGKIDLVSEPGATRFQVRLPITVPRRQ